MEFTARAMVLALDLWSFLGQAKFMEPGFELFKVRHLLVIY